MPDLYLIPFIVILCILLAAIIVKRINVSYEKKQIYFSFFASVFCFPAILKGSIPVPLIYLIIMAVSNGNSFLKVMSYISQEWLANLCGFLAMIIAMFILSGFMNLETPTKKDEEE